MGPKAMHPEDNIERLIHIGYYKAPKGKCPTPAPIRESCEYVELLTGGRVFFNDGAGRRECSCGAIFWHQPGECTICESDPEDPYECLTILFKMRPPFRRIAPRMTFWEPHEAKSFAEEALRAFHDDSVDRATLCRYAHSRLLWAAFNDARRRKGSEDLPPPLARALAAISSSFHEPLDVADLAEQAKVSVPYLHSLFKKHLGTAPHQALLERRLLEARNLLASSDLNLKTVAYNCGFPSVEHFCRVFKERFTSTAAEFRRRQMPEAVLGRHGGKRD